MESSEVEQLRKEVSALKSQLEKVSSAKEEIRKPSTSASGQSSKSKTSDQKPTVRRKLRFGFKCGELGHVVWKCKKQPNPDLVSQRFEEARQEN